MKIKGGGCLVAALLAALAIGITLGKVLGMEFHPYKAPELQLMQGAEDYDLMEGITYPSDEYELNIVDDGNFNIDTPGVYKVQYSLTPILPDKAHGGETKPGTDTQTSGGSKPSEPETATQAQTEESGSTVPETTQAQTEEDGTTVPETTQAQTGEDGSTVPETTQAQTGEDGTTVPETTQAQTGEDGPTVPETTQAQTEEDGSTVPETTQAQTEEDGSAVPETTQAQTEEDGAAVPDTTQAQTEEDGAVVPDTSTQDQTEESGTAPLKTYAQARTKGDKTIILETSARPQTKAKGSGTNVLERVHSIKSKASGTSDGMKRDSIKKEKDSSSMSTPVKILAKLTGRVYAEEVNLKPPGTYEEGKLEEGSGIIYFTRNIRVIPVKATIQYEDKLLQLPSNTELYQLDTDTSSQEEETATPSDATEETATPSDATEKTLTTLSDGSSVTLVPEPSGTTATLVSKPSGTAAVLAPEPSGTAATPVPEPSGTAAVLAPEPSDTAAASVFEPSYRATTPSSATPSEAEGPLSLIDGSILTQGAFLADQKGEPVSGAEITVSDDKELRKAAVITVSPAGDTEVILKPGTYRIGLTCVNPETGETITARRPVRIIGVEQILFDAPTLILGTNNTSYDLTAGMSAKSEQGVTVPVTVKDQSELEAAKETVLDADTGKQGVELKKGTYHVTLAAVHPVSGEEFICVREVSVRDGIYIYAPDLTVPADTTDYDPLAGASVKDDTGKAVDSPVWIKDMSSLYGDGNGNVLPATPSTAIPSTATPSTAGPAATDTLAATNRSSAMPFSVVPLPAQMLMAMPADTYPPLKEGGSYQIVLASTDPEGREITAFRTLRAGNNSHAVLWKTSLATSGTFYKYIPAIDPDAATAIKDLTSDWRTAQQVIIDMSGDDSLRASAPGSGNLADTVKGGMNGSKLKSVTLDLHGYKLSLEGDVAFNTSLMWTLQSMAKSGGAHLMATLATNGHVLERDDNKRVAGFMYLSDLTFDMPPDSTEAMRIDSTWSLDNIKLPPRAVTKRQSTGGTGALSLGSNVDLGGMAAGDGLSLRVTSYGTGNYLGYNRGIGGGCSPYRIPGQGCNP